MKRLIVILGLILIAAGCSTHGGYSLGQGGPRWVALSIENDPDDANKFLLVGPTPDTTYLQKSEKVMWIVTNSSTKKLMSLKISGFKDSATNADKVFGDDPADHVFNFGPLEPRDQDSMKESKKATHEGNFKYKIEFSMEGGFTDQKDPRFIVTQ